MPDGCPVLFSDIINNVAKRKREDRNEQVAGVHMRLHELKIQNECIQGDLLRIRIEDGAEVASMSGEIEPIAMGSDEGLGEHTAFLYEPTQELLVVQRNVYGVSSSRLAQYFEKVGNLREPIFLDPVYTEDAIDRLAKLESATRLELRMAGPIDPNQFRGSSGMKDFIELSKALRAPAASVVFSLGRKWRGKSLHIPTLKRFIKDAFEILGVSAESFSKIEISGRTENEERDVLDLVAERMVAVRKVRQNAYRNLSFAGRRGALLDALEEKREELRRLFKEDSVAQRKNGR